MGAGSAPRLLTARNPVVHFMLERRRAECMPFVGDLIEQQTFAVDCKLFEPVERFSPRLVPDRHGDVDPQTAPWEIRGEQNQTRIVGPHPFRQGTISGEPAADELAAGIRGPRVIDRATMADAERTWLSAVHLMGVNLDLEPAVAARGAGAALPPFRSRALPGAA